MCMCVIYGKTTNIFTVRTHSFNIYRQYSRVEDKQVAIMQRYGNKNGVKHYAEFVNLKASFFWIIGTVQGGTPAMRPWQSTCSSADSFL